LRAGLSLRGFRPSIQQFLIGCRRGDGGVVSSDASTLEQHQSLGLLGLGGGDAFMVELHEGLCRQGLASHR